MQRATNVFEFADGPLKGGKLVLPVVKDDDNVPSILVVQLINEGMDENGEDTLPCYYHCYLLEEDSTYVLVQNTDRALGMVKAVIYEEHEAFQGLHEKSRKDLERN